MPRFEVGYKQSPWVRCNCGKIHVVMFPNTYCPQCGTTLHPFQYTPEKPIPPQKSKYAKRIDVNGVEWKVCDPYPTYYRYADNKIVMRSANAAPFADEKEEAK